MSLTNLFLQVAFFGAEWVMWLLVGLSFVSVAIMIERALFFKGRGVDADALGRQLNTALRSKNLEQALKLVRGSQAIECRVLAAGLAEMPRGAHAVSEAMLSAKARERLRWEAHLPILATLGSNAPFIGLLGTVLGIIKASQELVQAPPTQQTATTAAMGGVFEALVATAVGLFVAIPAVVAYNFFQRRVRARISQSDSLAHLLLSLMKPDSAPRPATSRPDHPLGDASSQPMPPGAGISPPPAAPPRAQQVP